MAINLKNARKALKIMETRSFEDHSSCPKDDDIRNGEQNFVIDLLKEVILDLQSDLNIE